MADNVNNEIKRINLIDPNDFTNQYAGNVFSDNKFNVSVPPEDLGIIVELSTYAKGRSILITSNNSNTTVTSKKINVKFNNNEIINLMTFSNDPTTGNQPNLTTKYTDLSTQLDTIDEALGLTSIDIDFNSSYTPMVNINFIDIRGGAIFQQGGSSKYSVFFRLPYPLFQLKIKGFYGRPVIYCLHLTKFTSKFNSQTGNFEISTNFVGYTYALLADMIIGYLKAAGETHDGKALLKQRNVISINTLLQKISQIDDSIKSQLNVNNTNATTLNAYQKGESQLQDLIDTVLKYSNNIQQLYTVKNLLKSTDTNKDVVAVDISSGTAVRDELYDNVNNFFADFQRQVKVYNTSTKNTNLNLIHNLGPVFTEITPVSLVAPIASSVSTSIQSAYSRYGISDDNKANEVAQRLNNAIPNCKSNVIAFVDFTDSLTVLNNTLVNLQSQEKDIEKALGEQLFDSVKSILGFDPNIRNITNIFTTHIEVLLQLIFNAAQKSKDPARVGQLSRFNNTDNLDINSNATKDDYNNNIFPFPEYQEKGEEKYLGSPGVLKNPEQVPEIQLVNDLYNGMIASEKVVETLNNLVSTAVMAWNSMNPIDSIKYQSKTPYDRIPNTTVPNDLATYIVLRATAYLGFSNVFLTTEEIKAFAVAEAQSVISKYSDNFNVINGLATNYKTPTDFLNASGVLGDPSKTVKTFVLRLLPQNSNAYTYTYIDENTTNRYILPTDQNFFGSGANYKLSTSTAEPSKYLLSSRICDTPDLKGVVDFAYYVDIIEKADYENTTILPATNYTSNSFIIQNLQGNPTGDVSSWLRSCSFNTAFGKYGVQDFTLADYSGTGDKTGLGSGIPFYSVFYNNSNINTINISGGRLAANIPDWDLYDAKGAVNNFTIFSSKIGFFESFIGATSIKANLLFANQKNRGQNLQAFNSNTVSFPFFGFAIDTEGQSSFQSLFGSRFYNFQNIYSKAYLFLHSFPWRGLVTAPDKGGIFNVDLIKNIFQYRAGFVQVPKLFPAFLGAIIWRYEKGGKIRGGKFNSSLTFSDNTINPKGSDPIKFANGDTSLLFRESQDQVYPETYQYCTKVKSGSDDVQYAMSFKENVLLFGDAFEYFDIESVIAKLPSPAKQVFLNEFYSFVNGTNGFTTQNFSAIQQMFEITAQNSTDAAWVNAFSQIKSKEVNSTNNVTNILVSITPKSNIGNYNVISYFSDHPNNYVLEYKQGGTLDVTLRSLFLDYKYISNSSWRIWGPTFNQATTISDCNATVYVGINDFNTYITAFNAEISNTQNAKASDFFNNKNSNEIKFEIYRTLKKIYDKWIANSDSASKAVFQCCTTGGILDKPSRLPTDTNISTVVPGDTNPQNLINSFRFINRAFEDIGDKLPINPVAVSKLLIDGTDNSFYDLFSRILTDNNMIFIPLPTFIDYSDRKSVESIFHAYPYYEAATIPTSGPSFVCMYVGQTSTKLDFGDTSDYPNDGMDLNHPATVGDDMKTDLKDYETPTAAFIVRYGQQNQNIFKDIVLDQAEFTETAESLRITDAIANSFSQTNQSYVGQNLYNVYSVRSYKAEVTMMGNAMIQPMMYFQLDNIPMFRGAYLIIGVKHHIQPNTMSTVFTGVRIKKIATPLVDAVTMYTSLLQGYELPTGAVAPPVSSGPYKLSTLYREVKKQVKSYFKGQGYSKELTAGIMGNMEIESQFNLSGRNLHDTLNTIDIGLIQWNSQSYPDVFVKYNAGQFSTAQQQLNYLTGMGTFKTFLSAANKVSNLDEQYAAFLFAHYVEVCCGCANTKGFTTLATIYGGPYANGWGCPQNDPNAPRFFPHKRSEAASAILKQLNDSTNELFW